MTIHVLDFLKCCEVFVCPCLQSLVLSSIQALSHSYIQSLMHSSMHPLILQMFIWCHYVQTVLSIGAQSVAYPPGPAPYLSTLSLVFCLSFEAFLWAFQPPSPTNGTPAPSTPYTVSLICWGFRNLMINWFKFCLK